MLSAKIKDNEAGRQRIRENKLYEKPVKAACTVKHEVTTLCTHLN